MFSKKIILGSSSPRREQLIRELGVEYVVRKKEVEEIYPKDSNVFAVPKLLAQLKAEPLKKTIQKEEVLLTSDTVVIKGEKILGKPTSPEDAKKMLQELSGATHEVVTGVYLFSPNKEMVFSVQTKVFFAPLSTAEIDYYIHNYKPFDKAGAYGIQEWIGRIGIEKIEGSFYNVMGLPIFDVWKALKEHF